MNNMHTMSQKGVGLRGKVTLYNSTTYAYKGDHKRYDGVTL